MVIKILKIKILGKAISKFECNVEGTNEMDEKLNIMCTMGNDSWYNGLGVRPTSNK
jgi:hypothetical protein